MFNSMIIVNAAEFNGSADKNGASPVILNVLAGKSPNRTVLSGTVAQMAGFETGKAYLVSCKEGEPDVTYGRRFVFSKIKELDALEILQSAKVLGEAQVFDVNAVDEVKASVQNQKSESFK